MNRDQALSKIKKCLALAKSSNPHEAAAAMRQAQKLMAEHQLTDTDIELADVQQVSCNARTSGVPAWESRLARLVADAFGCDLILLREQVLIGFTAKTKTKIVFVGVGCAADIAGYAYDVLSRQCAKDRAAHLAKQNKRIKASTKTARADAFATGWVGGVREKLERFASPEKNTLLIAQYMAQQWPDSTEREAKNRSKNRFVSNNDIYEGHRAGSNAQLDRGVGAPPAQGLLA